jgi:integrase
VKNRHSGRRGGPVPRSAIPGRSRSGVYNLGLDEFFAWYSQEPRPGFTKATVAAWRVALEARGLGAVSINVRITAVRKLAVEAADNGLLAPELANGITRVKGVASKGVRLGNWLTAKQAQSLLNAPDATTNKGLRDRAVLAVLLGCGLQGKRRHSSTSSSGVVRRGSGRKAWPGSHGAHADLGEGGDRRLDRSRRHCRWPRVPVPLTSPAKFAQPPCPRKSFGS